MSNEEDAEEDMLEGIQAAKPADSEAVLSRLLSGDSAGAREEAKRRCWSLPLLETVEQALTAARVYDEPMPDDAEPEEFLEYARGTNESAQAGFVAIATVEMLVNRVGSLSQCKVLAQWLVDQLRGQPVEPVALSVDTLLAHAQAHSQAEYLVRWRGSLWVISALNLTFNEQWVYGPQPGQTVPIVDLDQVWYLAPQ